MAIPTSKEIADFSSFNSGGRENVPEFKRNLYFELEKAMQKRQIIALSGMRRVGKSTLIKQLLAKTGGAYFSFDEQRYQNIESLDAVIGAFLQMGFETIALDEIGNIDNWAGTLKKYYDRGSIKFIVSGSASLKIKKGNESLAGRMLEFRAPPLQFDEYLEKAGLKQERRLWRMRQYADESERFLRVGAFMEICNEDEEFARKYISSVVDKSVFEDIPAMFRIEHRAKLSELLRYCASFSASLFSEVSLANTIGISRGTVADYLKYLEQTYLAKVVHEEGSYARALQKSKKLFVSCPSIYWVLTDSFSEGVAAEVAVFDRLIAWGKAPLFYRDSRKREIDFIVDGVPVEVKCRRYIKEEDFNSLLYYMKERKKTFGVLVSKDRFDTKKINGMQILQIPLSVFLSAQSPSIIFEGLINE